MDGSRIGCQPGKITLVDIRGQVAEVVEVDHGPRYVAMNPLNLQGGGCKFYKFFLELRSAKLGEADTIGHRASRKKTGASFPDLRLVFSSKNPQVGKKSIVQAVRILLIMAYG